MMGARATRWVEFIEAAVVDLCDGFNFGITAFASLHPLLGNASKTKTYN